MKIENTFYRFHGNNQEYRTVVSGISNDFPRSRNHWASTSWQNDFGEELGKKSVNSLP